jgi:hypothetical protein
MSLRHAAHDGLPQTLHFASFLKKWKVALQKVQLLFAAPPSVGAAADVISFLVMSAWGFR